MKQIHLCIISLEKNWTKATCCSIFWPLAAKENEPNWIAKDICRQSLPKKKTSEVIKIANSPTEKFSYYLLTAPDNLEALDWSPWCYFTESSSSCHSSNQVGTTFKNAWQTRLHNNYSRKTQVKVLTMMKGLQLLRLWAFLLSLSRENDWIVLTGLRRLAAWTISSSFEAKRSLCYCCLQKMKITTKSVITVKTPQTVFRWMDGIRTSHWVGYYRHTEIFLAILKAIDLLPFKEPE